MRKELHKALVDNIPEVGGRVYPIIMPQDTQHKCIVYRVIGNHDTTGITCTTPISTRYAVQIDVFAKTYSESVDLMQQVADVLRANFLIFNLSSYEDFANITVKYRQIIDFQIEDKPVFVAPPQPTQPIIVNHGVPVVNHGNQIIP